MHDADVRARASEHPIARAVDHVAALLESVTASWHTESVTIDQLIKESEVSFVQAGGTRDHEDFIFALEEHQTKSRASGSLRRCVLNSLPDGVSPSENGLPSFRRSVACAQVSPGTMHMIMMTCLDAMFL